MCVLHLVVCSLSLLAWDTDRQLASFKMSNEFWIECDQVRYDKKALFLPECVWLVQCEHVGYCGTCV